MQTLRNHIFICCILIASLGMAAVGFADKIILKDGSVETSDRIWESERYIHFILNGTQEVEIRYAKEIVARIERLESVGDPSLEKSAAHTENSDIKIDLSGKNVRNTAPIPEQRPTVALGRPLEVHRKLVKENRGVSFYDPRRPMRYWAMRNSKHKKLTSALDAMAKPYDRSAQWVETHMGQENDLGKIHFSLARQFQREVTGTGNSDPLEPSLEKSELPLAEGVIEQIDGKTDGSLKPSPNQPQLDAGIRFYDPRRVEKYWSGQMTRHHTLKEALNTLAHKYGVTPSWIETHMGDTNDLSVIHRNIQIHLKQR